MNPRVAPKSAAVVLSLLMLFGSACSKGGSASKQLPKAILEVATALKLGSDDAARLVDDARGLRGVGDDVVADILANRTAVTAVDGAVAKHEATVLVAAGSDGVAILKDATCSLVLQTIDRSRAPSPSEVFDALLAAGLSQLTNSQLSGLAYDLANEISSSTNAGQDGLRLIILQYRYC